MEKILKNGKKVKFVHDQIITAEGMAKQKNSLVPWNSSIEFGVLILTQAEENITYNPNQITLNQYVIPIANAAPTCPSPNLNTKPQQVGMKKIREAIELRNKGRIKLCACKKRTSIWRIP